MLLQTIRSTAALLVLLAAACGVEAPEAAATFAELRVSPPASTVVLIHGMGGFKDLAGIDYFYRVPESFRRAGAKVFVPGTTTFGSIEKRAGELKAQLDRLDGPLVLIAHSQGGLDARYLISKLGYAGRVKALVTIATPHHGTPVADVLLGLAPGPAIDAANALLGLFGWSLDGAQEVTTSYLEGTFNPSVPDDPAVTYWSFSGEASPFGIGGVPGSRPGWLHSELIATWTLMDALGVRSDGIVPEASAHWGEFQGVIPGDHLGEVNQPLGYVPDFAAHHFYRSLLGRLHDQGW